MPSNNPSIPGLHHVTAITADAQKNIDFYCGVLGLRLVKLTVNFDDASSYHLYYSDELGRPGTALTFFVWAGAHRGRVGPPQVSTTAFSVPTSALDYWEKRLREKSVASQSPIERFGRRVVALTDPDGMQLELVGVDQPKGEPWAAGPIPAEFAIRSFHSVTISTEGYENTAKLLTDVMGFTAAGSEQNRFRYRVASDDFASTVDLLCAPDGRRGNLGAGIVHHVAFRTPDDAQQLLWRNRLAELEYSVSPVMDRTYFHSIYFREPSGVLFEIATSGPGFTFDEPADKLGERLKLPPWLQQKEIEQSLTPLHLPTSRGG